MKVIIDIPENIYAAITTENLRKRPTFDAYDMCIMSDRVRNGIPLEKLINILGERRSGLVGVYGDLGGAVAGVIKLIEKIYYDNQIKENKQ